MTALEMDPQIRARWVAALRSGKFEQGRDYLRWGDKLCCLGVLCELAAADGVIPSPRPGMGNSWLYAEAGGMLPPAVMEWAGLASTDPQVGGITLSTRNDGLTLDEAESADEPRHPVEPHTFAQIASVIEGRAA